MLTQEPDQHFPDKKIIEEKGSYEEVNQQTHITDKLPNKGYMLHP